MVRQVAGTTGAELLWAQSEVTCGPEQCAQAASQVTEQARVVPPIASCIHIRFRPDRFEARKFLHQRLAQLLQQMGNEHTPTHERSWSELLGLLAEELLCTVKVPSRERGALMVCSLSWSTSVARLALTVARLKAGDIPPSLVDAPIARAASAGPDALGMTAADAAAGMPHPHRCRGSASSVSSRTRIESVGRASQNAERSPAGALHRAARYRLRRCSPRGTLRALRCIHRRARAQATTAYLRCGCY